MSELPSNIKDDVAPVPIDAAASDAVDVVHKVKRKPSSPGDAGDGDAASPAQQQEKGHASTDGDGEQKAAETTQHPPSAGAPDTPVDSAPSHNPSFEKPTDASSTNAIKTSRPPEFTDKPSSSSKSKVKASRPKKRSFWARLFHALVPCVGPSAAHATNVGMKYAPPTPFGEKQRDDEKKDRAQDGSTSTSHTHTQTVEPSTTTPTLAPAPHTLPSQQIQISPTITPTPVTIADPAVIVPPSPKSHRLPKEVTAGVTSGAVQPPGSTGGEDPELDRERESDRSDSSSFTDEEEHERGVLSPNVGAGAGAGLHEEDLEDEEDRLIMNGGVGIPIGPDGIPRPLLPPVVAQHNGRKCLVLDLDETLVHSSFKLIPQADYVVPVEIEWQWHNVYVIKRPGVDNFLKQMGELYEIVVFTASLSKYADPVLDKLDVHKVVSHRLFRESCYNHKGNYVKDLSQLGRPSSDMIILDNSPASYIFHPNNAVPVSSWFNDPHDTELTDLVPFLADLRTTDDVRGVLDGGL